MNQSIPFGSCEGNLFLRVFVVAQMGSMNWRPSFRPLITVTVLIELNDLGQISLEVTGLEVGPVKGENSLPCGLCLSRGAGFMRESM
ncbi:MAG: hypothetical protein CM1200mP14_10970 [Gammaproteobacteria bacterium]|nr:MAG: hypothetical protein CM1200mP14_10970 [Gammaproteobacteria bacterium]